jgi:7-cyano-7-deazaguanine synthase
MSRKKGVALLSGGLDSATAAAVAINQGFEVYGLSFDYGQRHKIELERSDRVANALGLADHKTVSVDLATLGGSALTSATPVPKGVDGNAPIDAGIPVTYVPARNTVFLSVALAYAETLHTGDIFIGVNALDYSGYPDCRPDYIEAFETMANLATKDAIEGAYRIKIHTPLIAMTKREIIVTGTGLGIDYSLTWSCYDPQPGERPCGLCDSCRLRAKGFHDAGLIDAAL